MTARASSGPLHSFEQWLYERALVHPHRTALVCGARRWTYAALDDLVDRFAAGLLEAGFQPGDRTVIVLPNGIEAVVAVLGTMRAGGVFAVLHERTPAPKVRFALDDTAATVLMAADPTLRGLDLDGTEVSVAITSGSVLPHRPGSERDRSFEELVARPATPQRPSVSPDDLCALLYTSGSSGIPKAVMQSHRTMDAAADAIASYLRNEPSDVVLNPLPLSFDYGLYNVLMPLRFGGCCVLERDFKALHRWLELIDREQVTGVPLVPSMAAMIVKLARSIRVDRPTVRYVTSTGQALPPAHGAALQRLFPNAQLYSMYGLTECKRATYLRPEEYANRPTSVGRAMPGVRLRLVDASGAVISRPFERGELLVEGRNVMLGYWRREKETRAVLSPGERPGERLLRTGDLFERDAEGFYYFVARLDDMVKSGGQRLSPREVEAVLREFDGVDSAAVYGRDHPILGTVLEAAVVPTDAGAKAHSVDVDALIEHCRRHLDPAAVPWRLAIVDELPRTLNGKTDYARLQSQAPPTSENRT